MTFAIMDFWHVHVNQEPHFLKGLEPKVALSSEFSELFDKVPVRILLHVLFHVFTAVGFLKVSFNALTSSLITF